MTFDKEVMTRSVSLTGDVFDPAGTLTGGIDHNIGSAIWHGFSVCVCVCVCVCVV